MIKLYKRTVKMHNDLRFFQKEVLENLKTNKHLIIVLTTCTLVY